MPPIRMAAAASAGSSGSQDPRNFRYRRRPEVLVRELDGEAVLLDLASGRYFGLNGTGRRLFELLDGERTVADLEDELATEFDAPRQTLASDVRSILETLLAEGLVERT
jgi:hypothetical protein